MYSSIYVCGHLLYIIFFMASFYNLFFFYNFMRIYLIFFIFLCFNYNLKLHKIIDMSTLQLEHG